MTLPKTYSERGGIILDLCGGSGAWSKPYMDSGYDVRIIDLPNDVRLFDLPAESIHGILAAPPCTKFCRARMCRGRPTDNEFAQGLSVVDACLRIILLCKPQWWALENPQGYLNRWLGKPQFKFDPCEFGDPWTKRTWLWGNFQIPWAKPTIAQASYIDNGRRAKKERSITPPGFAQCFFEANQ